MRMLLMVRARWSAGEVGLNKSTVVDFATIERPGGRRVGEIRIPEVGNEWERRANVSQSASLQSDEAE